MAVVWRAWDTRLEREVALKEPVVPNGMDAATIDEFSQRFIREAKAAAGLNHPGVVTIYNAEVYDGRPVIAMELIHGETLSALLQRGALGPEVAASMLGQMLDAIGYAHSRGIVHRDIKPDNIFVLPDGRLKLADFGIAHVESSSTLTQAGTVMGTPGYMSPEQITGGPIDARADLFSIGVVGYEMLTGRNPFGASDGTAPTVVMFRVVQEDVPEVREVTPSVPPALSDSIRVAIAKDPSYRFTDAAAMIDAVHGGNVVIAGSVRSVTKGAPRPLYASPAGPSLSADGQKTSQTVYFALAAAGVLIIAAVLGLALSGTGPGGRSATASPAVAPLLSAESAAVQSADTAAKTTSTETEDRAAVTQAVEDWRAAWQAMDINRYMGTYAPGFHSAYKGYDYNAWRAWKADVFTTYSYQTVAISGLDVTVSRDTAQVSFVQDFRSDSRRGGAEYHDTGRKTLAFAREGGRWFITGEEFRKY